ncbi:MAG TPA: PKD domain-containing protein [Thermoanaerobaculia bacterium]
MIASLVVALAAGSAFAQNYPLPGSASAAPVLCVNCEGSNSSGEAIKNLPTYPFRAPISRFVGRYVDSSTTLSIQHVGFRTARSGRVRIAPETRGNVSPRAYLTVGECVGSYTLPAFFNTTLPSALESVGSISTGEPVGGKGRSPLERIQMFDSFIYPEARSSGWTWQLYDAQHTLGDYDFDDRGNVLAAFPPYGWGIMRDGATGATHMTKMSQVATDSVIPQPFRIISIRNGSRYYALISDTGATKHMRWDVTDATNPVLSAVRTGNTFGIGAWSKHEATAKLAYLGGDQKLHIWNYADIVGSGQEIISFSPSAGKRFLDVAFDENGNLWAAESDYPRAGNNVLVKISPSGSTYVRQTFDVYGKKFSPQFISAGGGFVALAGTGTIYNGGAGLDVILLKVAGGVPTKVDTDDFFSKYYHNAPSGYAQPPVNGGYTNFQSGINVFKYDNKVYLFYSAFGLGDVFELEGSDSISVQMKTASYGTPNPNAKSTVAGPYPGDVVSFQAKSSNPAQTYTVNWDFGNPDSGSLNYKSSSTGVDVTHQFTGYTTAAQITATKSVTATVSGESSISAAAPVALKAPTARIGFPVGVAIWDAVTNATAGLEVVAGQSFTDASDGSVESHFGTWTVDGVDTKIKPNGTVPVGGLGQHTVKLTASYGRYDATTFANSAPYNTSTQTINYKVVPFRVKLNPAVKSGSNVTFSGTGLYSSDTALLSATQWTVTWTLNGTGASALATQSSTVAIGSIPNFVVPAPIAPNSTITVDVAVDPTKVVGSVASAQASELLATPDPKITVTGCAHANDPCTLTADSVGGSSTADWGVLWTVKQGATTLFTSTLNPYNPVLAAAGTYTITMKATKSVFEANATDKILSVAAALCGELPTKDYISISSSCTSNCPVNENITFLASAFGYSYQDCDTFTWNFGDGGTANTKRADHKFTTKKTYTVKLTVKNATNTVGISVDEPINVGGNTIPDPPTDTCTAPANIAFDWSGTQGCTASSPCKVGESVTFTGRRGSSALQSCDNVAWDFGDGHTSTSRSLSRNTYDAAGTYTVALVVTNEFGTASATPRTITIVPAGGGACSTAPTEGNFTVRYEGGTSGCRETNATPCQKGETINFRIGTFLYTMQSCDQVQWTFGDGSATSSSTTPSHVYTGSATSFQVSLKVTNSAGTATVSDTIPFGNITPTEPIPTLTYENFPTTGQTGKPVTFKVNSNYSSTGWIWNFGDGSADDTSQSSQTATSRTISHTFTKTGTFTVRAFARNAAGAATDTAGAVLNAITITAAPAEPEYLYLLPVVTHGPGQNNSTWRTDVQIYSQDPTVSPSKPLSMTAKMRDMTRTLEIPSSTYIYEDFMRVFTPSNDSGPVVITAKGQYAPQIWTRTYNQTEAGTFGQFIPAIRIDDAGSGSSFGTGKYFVAGMRHDARYRTNIGFVNPNTSTINVLVKVYNDQGASIGSFTRTLSSFQLEQFPMTDARGLGAENTLIDDRPFSLEISVPEGQWLLAYASLIDGGSNDPVYIQAVRESELKSQDFRSIMVPGVGHTGPWRSDATVFNPNGRPINVDLTYYDGTGQKKGEALNVPIRAGEFLQYDDLIKQGVFGAVPDSVGMMKVAVTSTFSEDLFPFTFARTYNDDGSGKTFGQGIGGFAVPRANVKPGKPALIPAVRDNTKFYTNIGLTNTTNADVTVTVKLLDPATGAEVKAPTYTLHAYQSVVGQYTLEGRDNASLKIEATGNIWAFASVIDKNTKDPEYVAATPLQ